MATSGNGNSAAKPKQSRSPARSNETDKEGPSFIWERVFGLFIGAVLIGATLYLIVTNHKYDEPNATYMKILLSLGAGVVGSTIPGFLHIEYKKKGLAVRAAGGVAVFLVTLYYTPAVVVVKPAKLVVNQPTRVDLRSFMGDSKDPKVLMESVVMATMDIPYVNVEEPARTAIVEFAVLHFELNGSSHRLPWEYFVNLHYPPLREYLDRIGSASPFPVVAGSPVTKEIMHKSSNLGWFKFMEEWRAGRDEYHVFKVVSTIKEAGNVESICTVDKVRSLREIEDVSNSSGGGVPMQMTMCCLEIPVERRVADCGSRVL